jgi:hypothetical protein
MIVLFIYDKFTVIHYTLGVRRNLSITEKTKKNLSPNYFNHG